MKHTITQKIEVTEEVEIITPCYRKDNANSPYYYKLTEEGGLLYVTRILILDRYQSIIKTTTITKDVIDAIEITEAEYNEAYNRVITYL